MIIVISSEAEKDLKQVLLYFESINLHDIAIDFSTRFKNVLSILREHPEMGSIRFSNIVKNKNSRYFVLGKYNYYIFYSLEGENINILRIISSKRDIFSILK